jgi:hypothetical protein
MEKDYSKVFEKVRGDVDEKNISFDDSKGLPAIEKAARDAAGAGNLTLVAWWDNKNHTGGPEEACKGEVPKCSRDYAVTHGASIRVLVNNGDYEFFYAKVPEDHVELDRDEVVNIHKQFGHGEYPGDIIGG